MNTIEINEAVVTSEVPVQPKKAPFVCPIDPAELAQCDSCQ